MWSVKVTIGQLVEDKASLFALQNVMKRKKQTIRVMKCLYLALNVNHLAITVFVKKRPKIFNAKGDKREERMLTYIPFEVIC